MTRTPANAVVVMLLLAVAGLIIAAMPVVRMEQVVITADRARAADTTVQAGNTAKTTLR